MHEFSRYYRCALFFGGHSSNPSFSGQMFSIKHVYRCFGFAPLGDILKRSKWSNITIWPFLEQPPSRLCDTCMASVGKGTPELMHGRNYSPTAAWRLTRLDHQGYLDHETGRHSPFLSVDGFRVETVVYDWLHNIFLGCGRDLFASGLKLLILEGVWGDHGGNWDSILAGIHLEMHQWCAAHGSLATRS